MSTGVVRSTRAASDAVRGMLRARVIPSLGRVTRTARIVTPLGWGVLLGAVAALALAALFGWAEMLALAILAVLVIAFAIPFVLGRTAYRVSVELASPRVVVGEPAVGRVIVLNTAHRAAPASRIELPVGKARAEFRMPRLAAGAEHDELFTIPTQRRAVLTLGPVTSVRTDPLGMLRREVTWTEPTELYVHPRVVRLASETAGFMRDLEGLPTRELADDDVSFHALREYSPGDDLRHVHWKSTARTQNLMIRQFEQTRRSHLVIALSTSRDDYVSEEEFELAVSITGSIALTALRDGKAVSVLVPGAVISAKTTTRLLDGLSAIELTSSTRGLAVLGREVRLAAPGASVVAFVTGAKTRPVDIRGASLRVPVTALSLCVRAATDEQLGRRSIGDVAMVSVPDLGSLRMAMRAVAA